MDLAAISSMKFALLLKFKFSIFTKKDCSQMILIFKSRTQSNSLHINRLGYLFSITYHQEIICSLRRIRIKVGINEQTYH